MLTREGEFSSCPGNHTRQKLRVRSRWVFKVENMSEEEGCAIRRLPPGFTFESHKRRQSPTTPNQAWDKNIPGLLLGEHCCIAVRNGIGVQQNGHTSQNSSAKTQGLLCRKVLSLVKSSNPAHSAGSAGSLHTDCSGFLCLTVSS